MRPQDLIKATILAEAGKDSTDFEDITHRKTIKKAKIEYGDFRRVESDDLEGKVIQDKISFLNVEATFVKRGDEVTFNDTTYSIEYFSLVVPGIYDIYAVLKTRSGSK